MRLDPDRQLRLDDVINHCLHCGMCLPVCPTYALSAQEQSSPRGRIRLIRSLADGTLELSRTFADEMEFCLDCQACQTACPAGVEYGELVEEARQWVADAGLEPFAARVAKRIILRGVLSSPFRTRLLGRLLRLYQRTGLREAVERSGILSLFSPSAEARHAMLPRASDAFFSDTSPELIRAKGKRRGAVAFLTGCVMDIAFADVHRQAVDLLAHNGYDVVVPRGQTCCGALHGHNGDLPEARRLARETVAAFSRVGADALVVDSAGCAAHIKAYGSLLSGDPAREAAAGLAAKTREITEFLFQIGFIPPTNRCEATVTYHEACHLVHSQKISREPRAILASLPGAALDELPEATWCCGSAGIYNVTRFDDSMKLLDRKMRNIASTGADIVATANPGCHLHIEYGMRRAGLSMRVKHPVSLLHESCGL